MPKYSVLITVYNSEKYLAECFDSVFSQTYNDFEVVAVDDGSTDKSGDICDRYAAEHSNMKVIHKKNHGVNRARKTAFENSVGDYILTVDCDDIVEPELIETVDGIITKYGCDLVMYDLLIFDDEKIKEIREMTEEEGLFIEKKPLYLILLDRRMNSLCTKCCIRENYGKAFLYKKYMNMCHGEDWFQSAVQVHNLKKGYYIKKPMYHYREVNSSLSHSYDLNSFRLNSDSIFEVKRMMEEDGCFDCETEAKWCAYARKVVNTLVISLSNADIGIKEKISTLKSVTDTEMYKIAVGKEADVCSNKKTILKFRLLRYGMYGILFRLMNKFS